MIRRGAPEGHAALHRAGTARPLAADRRAHRCLRARRDPLRTAVPASAYDGTSDQDDRRRYPRPASATAGRDRAVDTGAAAGHRPDGDGAGPGAPVPTALDMAPICAASSRDGRCSRGPRSMPRRWAAARAAHLQHITEWLQLRLIYPHEAERLRGAYGRSTRARTTGSSRAARSRTRRSRSISAPSCSSSAACSTSSRAGGMSGRGHRAAIRGARAAVRRAQPRGAASLPPGPRAWRSLFTLRQSRCCRSCC